MDTIEEFTPEELGVSEHHPNVPMGVSQWRNHGMKYYYWEFFKRKIEKDIVEEFLTGARCMTCGDKKEPNELSDMCIKCLEEK